VRDLLFETPWYLPTLLVLVGITLFVIGNARVEARTRNWGLAVIGLAIVLMLVSWMVQTPKERAVEQTRQIVDAFEKRDWTKCASLLPQRVTVGLANYPKAKYGTKDELVKAAKTATDRDDYTAIHNLSINAQQNETQIAVYLDVISTQKITGGRPLTSSWEFDYTEAADGWGLDRITALRIANRPVDEVITFFPN